jgi:hypothetical protein
MKYIISKEQYNLISEALGVPDSILGAAEELYDIFLKDLSSITKKSNKYQFAGKIDVILGDKKKVVLNGYELDVEVTNIDEFEGPPQIGTMGMSQNVVFDKKIMMKKIDESNVAEFSISFIAGDEWEPHQLYEYFSKDRDFQVSVLAHELKHKYDKQANLIGLIGPDAEYHALRSVPKFGIDVIDNKFMYYLYYTQLAEDLVRTTEVASRIKSKNISQSEFIDFLRKNETFQTLVEIKNFTLEKFINGIMKEMPKVDEIIRMFGDDPNVMDTTDKVREILNLVQINLINQKIDTFNEFVGGPTTNIMNMFRMFGGNVPKEYEEVEKVKENFYNYVTKFEGRPLDFFKQEFNRFNTVSNKTIRKLSKLYAMTHKKPTNESIINWNLHMKLMEKKYGKKKIEFNLRKLL